MDLNRLSKSIDTELIKDQGLLKALENETKKLKNMAHLKVNYELKGEPVFMNSEKELVIFRIVQEAFNNVIRHSKATEIWLMLNYDSSTLNLMIRDNGIGFHKKEIDSSKEDQHAGLNNMNTRAKVFGGNFRLESEPKKGTQIFVSIPYHS